MVHVKDDVPEKTIVVPKHGGEWEMIPLSALNQFLFCPRRAALIYIEGIFKDNEHTLLGSLAHENADLPGFEYRAGWKLLRALPVWSESLGLNGKADIVEVRESGGCIIEARPVEYKSGRKSRWVNDHAQLCAQALCLETMFGISIAEGFIFHAKSRQRSAVPFDEALRTLTLHAIRDLRQLLNQGQVPPVDLQPRCDGCSLREICLPEIDDTPRDDLFHPL